jgi:Reverse transcriptase (RNA-dependent DNA polymerase)
LCILSLSVNNVTLTDPIDIANHFNEFFTSVAQNIVDEINPTDNPPVNIPNNVNVNDVPLFSLSDTPVSQAEIIAATKLLQPKMTLDMDGLSIWLVQRVILAIATPLQHIFFESFRQGIVPSQFKIAKIIPVFKSGAKDCMDNYRPISLLNSLSKIMEKIVYNRLTCFLEENSIISNFQFGFRKAHSTLHPLIQFTNAVSKALDEKNHTIAIFCDLRKAFDTVDHKILLSKLHKIGVRGPELLWFQDYLSNRKQFVHVQWCKQSAFKYINRCSTGVSTWSTSVFIIHK